MLHGEGREEVLLPVGDHALYLQADVQAWVGVGGVGAEMCEGGYQQWVRDICSLIKLGREETKRILPPHSLMLYSGKDVLIHSRVGCKGLIVT